MSNRAIGILSIIFILLGFYLYLFETEKTDEADKPAEVEKLLNVDPENVVEIVLTRKKERIVFKKKAGQWFAEEPVRRKARNERIKDILDIFDLGIVRDITTDLADASKYGLDRPKIAFSLKFKDEKVNQTLLIGDDSPGSIGCYARLRSQSRIVLLGILYKRELEYKLETFLDQSASQNNEP